MNGIIELKDRVIARNGSKGEIGWRGAQSWSEGCK